MTRRLVAMPSTTEDHIGQDPPPDG